MIVVIVHISTCTTWGSKHQVIITIRCDKRIFYVKFIFRYCLNNSILNLFKSALIYVFLCVSVEQFFMISANVFYIRRIHIGLRLPPTPAAYNSKQEHFITTIICKATHFPNIQYKRWLINTHVKSFINSSSILQ